jgi:hypothetical protein
MSGLAIEDMEGDAFRGRGGGVKRDRANYSPILITPFQFARGAMASPFLKQPEHSTPGAIDTFPFEGNGRASLTLLVAETARFAHSGYPHAGRIRWSSTPIQSTCGFELIARVDVPSGSKGEPKAAVER